jgi:hypothetical protein
MFDPSQSSLVFINSCFSFSFATLFFLGAEVLQSPLQHVWWTPLPAYLIIVVWQKYSKYYIPLQFYRNCPENDLEELCTYSITLVLGLIGLACVKWPNSVLFFLAILIMLNLWKTKQMRNSLASATNTPTFAIEEIEHQSRKLWLNLIILLNLLHLLIAWRHHLTPVMFAVIGGTISIPLHLMAQVLYKERYPKYKPDQVKYANAIAAAWAPANQPGAKR